MVDKVPFKQNVNIGSTLDDQLGPCASPFEAESLEVFVAKMAEMKCNEDAFGTINFQEKLIEDQSDVSKYLDINGALALTYGPVSGNAEVQFAMNNVASDLDISLMIKATHVGEYKAANEVLLNKLKLKDRIANGISKEMTKEEFTKQYGKYLIIGIENGGKMLYTQTIKARNKSDKLKAGGLLQVKLNQTGFSVEGSAKGEFKDEEYSNHVNIETKKTIQPSYNDKDDLIGTVIGQLEKLTDPNISKNDDFIKNHASLKGEIEKNLQKYFAAKLEPVYFIVKELEHISCVADAFAEKAGKAGNWDGIRIESFCEFSNKLFVKLNWMQNTIKRYEENISSLDLNNKDNKELSQLKQLYESALATKIAAMKTVNRNELYGNAKKYNELARLRDIGESKEDNDKKEVCKPFIQIRISELTSQFTEDIKIPLEKISELQLPKPNEAEQKLKLVWVHAKLVIMQSKIKDYETKLLGSWNLNDENDKKLNDNIYKWQKQITNKILQLSSIGEKQVGEEAVNEDKNKKKKKKKKKNNDNKGEIGKNWVEINIAQLEKEFEEEIEIPSQKRLSTLTNGGGPINSNKNGSDIEQVEKGKALVGSNNYHYYSVGHGLNYGGICKNKACQAYNEPVIMERGFSEKLKEKTTLEGICPLDEENEKDVICPGCQKIFELEEYFLYQCDCKIVFHKKNDEKRDLKAVDHTPRDEDFIRLGKYKAGDSVNANYSNYSYLKFYVCEPDKMNDYAHKIKM